MNSVQWQAAQDIVGSGASWFKTMPPEDIHRMVSVLVAEVKRLSAENGSMSSAISDAIHQIIEVGDVEEGISILDGWASDE